MFVALLAACGIFEGSAPATIEIQTSADSLFPSAPQVQLTAIVRDEDGTPMDMPVSWGVPNTAFKVTTTGNQSGVFGWTGQPSGLLEPVLITASAGAVTKEFAIISCAERGIKIKNSSYVAIGRPVPVHAFVKALDNTGRTTELSAPSVRVTSSNPSIVTVRNDSLVPMGSGSSLLTYEGCGESDTLTVTTTPVMYAVTRIEPVAGISSTGVALNDNGVVVGKTSQSGPFMNFLWTGTTFVDLGDCVPVGITDDSRVLCSGNGPRIWENGVATIQDTFTLQSSYKPVINRLGVVTARASDSILVWRAPGDFTKHRFGGTFTGSAHVPFDGNTVGDLAGICGACNGPYSSPFVWRSGSTHRLNHWGRVGEAYAINDSADVVGMHEAEIAQRYMAVRWRFRNGWEIEVPRAPYNDVGRSALDINDHGVIVGSGSRGGFVWSGSRFTLLVDVVDGAWTSISAVAINNRGQILASGTTTGCSGAVLLKPMNP